jgi:uncharacterized membrane protein
MNTVAKVFVVLNLVFSLLYVGVAATLLGKQENWKQKFFEEEKGRKDDNAKSEKEIKFKESQIGALRSDVETLRAGTDNLKTQLEGQINENKNLEKKWNEMMTEVQALKANNDKLSNNLSEMSKQKDDLGKALEQKTAECGDALKLRDQSVDDHQRVKEQLKDMKVSLDDLKQRHVDLAKKKAELEWILARVQEEYHITLGEVFPAIPKIDGRVVGVSNRINLIVISVGEEDQVKVGFEFTIYRGNTYVGKMVVEKVYPRQAAGRVLLEKTKDKVQAGDSVTTQVF